MVVSGGHGLGDQVLDWGSVLKEGVQTATDIYTAQQDAKRLEREREFQLKMARLTQQASIGQAKDDSGVTTQDGMFGGVSNTTVFMIGGAILVGGLLFLGGRRRR
jgi:LPXTG-motif cell wall-anchored protein